MFHCVLDWMAYKVQFPGRKMKTALVIYGAQGAGKGIVEKLMDVLGRQYCLTVHNSELWCAQNYSPIRQMFGNERCVVVTHKRKPLFWRSLHVRVRTSLCLLIEGSQSQVARSMGCA